MEGNKIHNMKGQTRDTKAQERQREMVCGWNIPEKKQKEKQKYSH
jgi:hypothetical protein